MVKIDYQKPQKIELKYLDINPSVPAWLWLFAIASILSMIYLVVLAYLGR